MILATVGTQLPFDRFISLIEEWAKGIEPAVDIVAQIGPSQYTSNVLTILNSAQPKIFENYLNQCEVIVSHAGMGSILTALRVQKPIIIFPRQASLNEHRKNFKDFFYVKGVKFILLYSTGVDRINQLPKRCLQRLPDRI
jgi:UDP-N-acetylglucosamine transferase subunit ALG13